MDGAATHIVIGNHLDSIKHSEGRYKLFVMDAVLLFDNGHDAVDAFNNVKAEAYLWDLGYPSSKPTLVQAKLMTQYTFLKSFPVHKITQHD